MKNLLIAGNWKMNETVSESVQLVNNIKNSLDASNLCRNVRILICPPFTALFSVNSIIKDFPVMLGAQNCHFEESGAFTGEISIPMLKECGCSYCIIGHSERRHKFGEQDDFINKKIKSLITKGITPILCIGEMLEERNSGKTETVLSQQLNEDLKEIDINSEVVIAYEPVWAIGTGVSATLDQINDTHNFIRRHLTALFPKVSPELLPILYGGSVNDKNAEEILGIKEVAGALIGGASLKSEKFVSIIQTAEKLQK